MQSQACRTTAGTPVSSLTKTASLILMMPSVKTISGSVCLLAMIWLHLEALQGAGLTAAQLKTNVCSLWIIKTVNTRSGHVLPSATAKLCLDRSSHAWITAIRRPMSASSTSNLKFASITRCSAILSAILDVGTQLLV